MVRVKYTRSLHDKKTKEDYNKAGLEKNFTKTEYLATRMEVRNLKVEVLEISGKTNFKYLRCTISNNATTEEEIKNRLEQIRMCMHLLNP